MNGTERYIEAVAYLKKLYEHLNVKIFNNKLSMPVITIQRDERNKTYGWFSEERVWKWKDEVSANCATCGDTDCLRDDSVYINCKEIVEREDYELNITAQEMDRSIKAIAGTLLHELCHQYAKANAVKDCSRAGKYHNKMFRFIAESHGLICRYDSKTGFSETIITNETEKIIEDFIKENGENVMYRSPVMKGQVVKSSNVRKYVCPICGNSCRATKQINIMCLDCKSPMQIEE